MSSPTAPEAPKTRKDQMAWGVAATSEPRWPASLATCLAALLNFLLPGKFTLGPPWLFAVLEMAIIVPLYISAPRRLPHEAKWQQMAAVVLIALVNVANISSLVLLVRTLLYNGKSVTGPELLFSSIAIWVTNVIVFGLWYWEIDRGGPDDRLRRDHNQPDFLFPQMQTPGCTVHDWTPAFFDYLYVAFTNATAFSPTDTMPLTPTAKMLMLIQAVISVLTITLVAARAVNILT